MTRGTTAEPIQSARTARRCSGQTEVDMPSRSWMGDTVRKQESRLADIRVDVISCVLYDVRGVNGRSQLARVSHSSTGARRTADAQGQSPCTSNVQTLVPGSVL